MKKKYFLISIILIFSSCFFGTISENLIIFNTIAKNKTVTIFLNKDTLEINKVEFVITNLKFKTNSFVQEFSYPQIIKDTNSTIYIPHSVSGNTEINFDLGVKDINKSYSQLENYNIDDGYYFLKIEGINRTTQKLFKYHIAKKNLNNKELNSIPISLNGFSDGGIFFNHVYIDLNLKEIFINPNIIKINDLNDNVIDNEDLQIKMLENVKNAFSLNIESD